MSSSKLEVELCKTKLGRLINVLTNGIPKNRLGECTPDLCETLDGQKGSACCSLGFKCPALSKSKKCNIYKLRPINCRAFPQNPSDLDLVKNCGFYFTKA